MQNLTDCLVYILKMLGFYPDTFIIDHKFCSMLSINIVKGIAKGLGSLTNHFCPANFKNKFTRASKRFNDNK